MPSLLPRLLPPPWPLMTAHGDGTAEAFYLIGGSQAYDDYHSRVQPPFEHWSHVLGFQGTQRTSVSTIPGMMHRVCWRPPGLPRVVGFEEAIFEITDAGAQEVAMPGLPGLFTSLWGPDDRTLFACGMIEPFAMWGDGRKWQQMALPPGTPALHHIEGFDANAVYFVGWGGTVLHWNGAGLGYVPVPTSRTLVKAARLDDKHLCIVGYDGTLLFGNRRAFRLIPTGTDEPILSIGRFDNAVWYPTEQGLWRFDGGSAPQRVLDFPIYWVNGLGNALTLFDWEKTYLFDGTNLDELDTTI